MTDRVCLGAITGAHGVRGQVKVKPFTEDPADIAAYGPVTDEAGERRFAISVTGMAKGQVLAKLEGISDRNAAEALRGTRLYVERSALPDTDDGSFYHADLVGLRVEGRDGEKIGTVTALYDFGAGDVVEIHCIDGESRMLPFTETVVPVVDLEGGRLVVEPPEGSLE
jgi:16S rRNA processing protein RimM